MAGVRVIFLIKAYIEGSRVMDLSSFGLPQFTIVGMAFV